MPRGQEEYVQVEEKGTAQATAMKARGLILNQPSADSSLCGDEAAAFQSPPPPLRCAYLVT